MLNVAWQNKQNNTTLKKKARLYYFLSGICITIFYLADCLTHKYQHENKILNWWTEYDIWLEEMYDWQQHMIDVS